MEANIDVKEWNLLQIKNNKGELSHYELAFYDTDSCVIINIKEGDMKWFKKSFESLLKES